MTSRRRAGAWRTGSWPVMAVVLVAALVIGARGDGSPATAEARVQRLAKSLACPECAGQSVAESNAPVAQAIRAEIGREVAAGRSDGQIKALLLDKYGQRVLLAPSGRGLVGLVWALPAAALVAGLAGLAAVFLRWRRWAGADRTPSPADRALVAARLEEEGPPR
ncbi:MAG: cytochrome c-type biogenesis protein CcmH [Acidimicrobiales bacterium]